MVCSLLFAFWRLCSFVTQRLHRRVVHTEPMHTGSSCQECARTPAERPCLQGGWPFCYEAARASNPPLWIVFSNLLSGRHALDAGEPDTLLCDQSCSGCAASFRCADAQAQKLGMVWVSREQGQYLSYALRLGLGAPLALCQRRPLILLFMLLVILHSAARVIPVLVRQRRTMRSRHIDTPHSAARVKPACASAADSALAKH